MLHTHTHFHIYFEQYASIRTSSLSLVINSIEYTTVGCSKFLVSFHSLIALKSPVVQFKTNLIFIFCIILFNILASGTICIFISKPKLTLNSPDISSIPSVSDIPVLKLQQAITRLRLNPKIASFYEMKKESCCTFKNVQRCD